MSKSLDVDRLLENLTSLAQRISQSQMYVAEKEDQAEGWWEKKRGGVPEGRFNYEPVGVHGREDVVCAERDRGGKTH